MITSCYRKPLSCSAALGLLASCFLPSCFTEPVPTTGAFEVTVMASYTDPPTAEPYGYTPYRFHMALDEAEDGTVTALFTSTSDVETGHFDHVGGQLALAEPIRLDLSADPSSGYFDARVTFESMTLGAADMDGDGMAEGLRGRASGIFEYVESDVILEVGFTAEVVGEPDSMVQGAPWQPAS